MYKNVLSRAALPLFALAATAAMLGCSTAPSAPAAPAAPAAAAPVRQAWQQGQGAAMASSPLAPVPGKNTITAAADIPLNKLSLPPGFKIEIWSTGTPGGRAMALGDNGKIYMGTRGLGRVYEVSDNGTTRTNRVVVDKLTQPAGVEFRNGSLYVMSIDKVLRFDGIANNPAVAPVDMTAAFNLPKEQHHNWKYIKFGPDGKLYVPFGAPCNICELPTAEYAQIRRYNADGSGMEVLATGVRNTVGFDFHPTTKELWFTNHGRDWLGDNSPDDTINRLAVKGANYGFPHCHAGTLADPDVKKANACAGVTQPVALMGPHTAVMGVQFYTGKMFPAAFQNAALVARKGSWNRTVKSGYDVVMVRANPDGSQAQVQPFITGFADPANNSFWGRPAYFLQLADGSLLLSDEQLGAIYRITYKAP
jgi:glucose/arabinose dehydrogenase